MGSNGGPIPWRSEDQFHCDHMPLLIPELWGHLCIECSKSQVRMPGLLPEILRAPPRNNSTDICLCNSPPSSSNPFSQGTPGRNCMSWTQIWRVTGRESGSPELLESPRTSPEVRRTSPEVFGDFPGSSLTVELSSNPEVPRKFPRLPRKFPGLPRTFPGLPRRFPRTSLEVSRFSGKPDTLS